MLADFLARKIEELRRANARLAHQPVALPMRHEREIAGLELARFNAVDLEPAAARSHEVEHHAVLQRR
jgi:hypothetical protein